MNGLHGRDYAKLSEARNVRRIQVLRVLDPPPQGVRRRILGEYLLERIERFAIRAVANRMDRKLEAISRRNSSDLHNCAHESYILARNVRCVAVRLEEPCAARAERSVRQNFPNATHGEMIVRVADVAVLRETLV